MKQGLPFQMVKTKTFYETLSEWVGDVFYEFLPEHGFEIRDEQIFMAFQLDRAFKEKNIIFAEAGVGTGKTVVYLLYAICYARYTSKPAIIACADDVLIEQLMKPGGDLEKLSKALDLQIDARLAKAHEQYLCLQKLDQVLSEPGATEVFTHIQKQLPEFVRKKETLQHFVPYGDRKEYPQITDDEWAKVNWDVFQDCMNCSKRHRCGLTLHRDHYRKSSDLIICSHDYYMEHVWSREARVREGQLPLLPEASCVVFDEGHLLEDAAQKALSYHLKHQTLVTILDQFHHQGLRESFLELVEKAYEANDLFFDQLLEHMYQVEGSERYELRGSPALYKSAKKLYDLVQQLGDELVIESESYFLDQYQQKVLEESIDTAEFSLKLFTQDQQSITWLQRDGEELILFLMPRTVAQTLHEYVFSEPKPVIFSSATLSVGDSFDYIAQSLGIKTYLSFSVPSPFDYPNQMRVYEPRTIVNETDPKELTIKKADWIKHRLLETGGKTLILFPSSTELARFKELNKHQEYPFPILYEGEGERSHMVQRFQYEVDAVLCASKLWEGLDIPGPSLSHVIIWELPFPPNDPVFQAKRKGREDAFWEVDVPAMLLRFKQGIGRLVRTREDQGTITLLAHSLASIPQLRELIEQALPQGVFIQDITIDQS